MTLLNDKKVCGCNEPLAPNTVHRKDSPCYVKENLPDEEILSIANKYEENMDSFGTRIGIPKEDIVDFAREILRKAQE